MSTDDDLVKLLAELGFVASGHALFAQTDAIVDALTVLRPDSEYPYLIQALARMNAGHAPEAERILREQALSIRADSALAKAYLGLALHQQGRRHERDQVLNEVLATNADADATALAHSLLEARPS